MRFRLIAGLVLAALLFASADVHALNIRQPQSGPGNAGNGSFNIEDDSPFTAGTPQTGVVGPGGINGLVIDSDPLYLAPGRVPVCKIASVTRNISNVAATLFSLPTAAIPLKIEVYWATDSNAGTTGTVSLGFSSADGGAGTELASAFNVRGGRNMPTTPSSGSLFTARSTTTFTRVTGLYAETGTSSNAGGPFNFRLCYYTP